MRLWRILLVLIVLPFSSSAYGADSPEQIDPQVPQRALVTECSSNTARDCIKSLSITDSEGQQFSSHTRNAPRLTFKDKLGQNADQNLDFWDFVRPDGSKGYIMLHSFLVTPTYKVGDTGNFPGYTLLMMENSNLKSTDTIKFEFSFGWLQPSYVNIWGSETNYHQEKMNGLMMITLTTKFTEMAKTYSNVNPNMFSKPDREFKADIVKPELRMIISDYSAQNYPFKNCFFKGAYIKTISNMQWAPSFEFGADGVIRARVGMPTYLPDGSHYSGYYETDIPSELIPCLYGVRNLTPSSQAIVHLLGVGDKEIVNTKTVNFDPKNSLRVSINGLQVGFPKFTLSFKNPLSTIVCVKGKLAKRITAEAPQCPKGFTKKS